MKMTSYSHHAKETETDDTTLPNWLELPRDITVNILHRLDTIDIVKNACQVCPLWWNICKDPLVYMVQHSHDPFHLFTIFS